MSDITESDVFTGNLIEGEPFGTFMTRSEMIGNSYDVGEFGTWYNMGYQYAFPPSTSKQEYQATLEKAKGVFFGNGARGINLQFTLYSRSVDWWINVQLIF